MGEKLQFYPIEISYRVADGKPEIMLFGKTADGQQICCIDASFMPYFYAIPKMGEQLIEDIKAVSIQGEETYKVEKVEELKKKYLGRDVTAIKVYVNIPDAVPEIRNVIKGWDNVMSTNEYDIPFVRRYLTDKGMTPLMLQDIEGEFVPQKMKYPCFRLSKIETAGENFLTEPKIVAFDIETYNPMGKEMAPEKNPILMISFYGDDIQKVITWKHFKTDNRAIEFVDSESELIEKFKEVIERYRPDIITGYFSDGFDLPYIKARANKYKIRLDLGIDHSDMRITTRGDTTHCLIKGMTHLDVFRSIRKMMGGTLETDRYSLNMVAQELLGDKKHEVEVDRLAHVWDNHPQELEKYCEYNLHDSRLAYGICRKILPNIIEMVKLVGLPLSEINRMGSSQLVEGFLLKECRTYNQIAPNKPSHDEITQRKTNTYAGGFVFEPKPGLFNHITVFDFRSLYPTIISSHNIDPGTLNCKCCKDTALKSPTEEGYWFCTKKKGFVPIIIEEIITRRSRIKEMMKKSKGGDIKAGDPGYMLEARQQGLKLLANSFYGYLGFYAARWYSLPCAKSTTAWGRHYIHKVIDSARLKGFDVLYSDTDSVFLSMNGKTKTDAINFADSINSELPGIMELEYEGYYPRGIFVFAKAGEFGAKKKYALLREDGTIKIRGFETVRRNWSLIAKEVQEEVLKVILNEGSAKNAVDFVRRVVADLRNNRIPIEKVIMNTQLQKEIGDYDAVGPHVAAAQRMKNKGLPVGPGTVIKFVVIKGGEKIRDRARLLDEAKQQDYDPDYYIMNQVIPSVLRIFNVLGINEEELLGEGKQSRLGNYF